MDLEQFPSSDSARRMLGYVSSGFYDQSYTGKWLFQVMGLEMDDAKKYFEELPFQAFPETATWGLRYHEEKYGLPAREDLPISDRRKRIFQRREVRTPMTPYAMEKLLRNVTDFQVRVADIHDGWKGVLKIPSPNVFEVILTGEGTAAVAEIRELLDRVKQSHTMYGLTYYDSSVYELPVRYDNGIYLRNSFYPRYNLEFLRLDRTWKLEEGKNLNGYNRDAELDFYPVRTYIQTETAAGTRAETAGIWSFCGARADIKTGAALSVKAEAKEEVRAGGETRVRTKAGYCAESSAYMTKMNQTDAAWRLSGSRKLDGGRYIL